MRVRKMLIPLVASLALLAGCKTGSPPSEPVPNPSNGIESLEIDAIIEKAKNALKQSRSFRVAGSSTSDGVTLTVDAVFAGDDVQAELVLNGIAVEMLTVDGTVHLKGGADLWLLILGAQGEQVAPLLADSYVVMPADPFELTIDALLSPEGTVTKGDVTTVAGKPALALASSLGGTLYVALVGEPYPLKLVNEEKGELEFSAFDADVTIQAPPADEVLDLSDFA